MRYASLAAAAIAVLAAIPAQAGEWGFLPVTNDPSFKFEPAIALKGGWMAPDVGGVGDDFAYGAELSFNCGLLRLPVGRIRHQLSYNRFDHDGLELQTVEFNPHYQVEAAPNLWIGAGPGVGFVWAESDRGSDANMWALNAGAGATYVMGHVTLGVESRYQWTQDDAVGATKGADNWLTTVKVGYKF
ncbi:MAG: hypothetical protein ACM33T_11150 [Solirubrobacterales bacterium]